MDDKFWNVGFYEMKKGYIEEDDCYVCLLCGKKVEKGIIYPVGELLYEAEKYIKKHIEEEHGSVFNFLNEQDKKITGLSEHQSNLLRMFYEGNSDAQIQKALNIGSTSTIRNHRFALKEKERQAKVFLVMMELLKERNKNVMQVVKPHKTAKMLDDRYNITEDEREKLLKKYFPNGVHEKLSTFSMKEKHKIIVLGEIINRFETGRIYTEKEVDNILKNIHGQEYVVIRRYLIQYGFMDRKKDCSAYWVKESKEKMPKEKVISGVYQIRNTKNGKIFISTGRNISKLNGTKFELNLGSFRNKALQNDWNEYGEDVFEFKILESFEEDGSVNNITKELKRLKDKWMDKLKPYGSQGYHVEKKLTN